MILAIWLVVFIVTAVPDLKYRKQEHRYWRPTQARPPSFPPNATCYNPPLVQLWCTIGKDYELSRLLGKSVWFWIAFLSFILFLPLALLARGNLTRSRTALFGFTIHRRPNENRNLLKFMIYCMIAYAVLADPVLNAILVIPLSDRGRSGRETVSPLQRFSISMAG
jgi:hypothetical protein